MINDGGKGDTPRPFSVPPEEFDKNFNTIFNKKEKRTEPVPFAGHMDLEESDDE